MNINLKGKRAIVCGSTQGIGKAIAVELASLGAHITLFARDNQAMKKVLAELDVSKKQVHQAISADFRFPDLVHEVISEYVQKTTEIHILINNSGGPALLSRCQKPTWLEGGIVPAYTKSKASWAAGNPRHRERGSRSCSAYPSPPP